MFPIEAFRNTLEKAVAILTQHGVKFHLTGGVTSIAYGEPRMTQDLDLVINNEATAARLDAFLTSLDKSDFLYDQDELRRAVSQRGMFQLLDREEALKLDIYARELILGELDRSELFEVFEGLELPIASRVDVATSKLVWVSKGSHKSRRDLRHLYAESSLHQQQQIQQLARDMSLDMLLKEVLSEPDEIV